MSVNQSSVPRRWWCNSNSWGAGDILAFTSVQAPLIFTPVGLHRVSQCVPLRPRVSSEKWRLEKMRFPFGSNRLANCVFCRIVEGQEPNEIFYKDDKYVAFSDIRPASENHLLIITTQHVRDITCLQGKTEVVDELVSVANQLLEKKGADLSDVRYGFHWPPFHLVSHLHLHAIQPASQMSLMSRLVFRHGLWFASPEVAKQWLQDREARELAARGPDDRDQLRAERRNSTAAQAEQVEDKDVAEVTKRMAKMNK